MWWQISNTGQLHRGPLRVVAINLVAALKDNHWYALVASHAIWRLVLDYWPFQRYICQQIKLLGDVRLLVAQVNPPKFAQPFWAFHHRHSA